MSQTICPIAHTTLTELCDRQLTRVLGDSSYTQPKVHEWNTEIINSILSALTPLTPQYKWILTSTIIEIVSDTKRGMHAAQGAYWNCEKDGKNAVARVVEHSNTRGTWTIMDSHLNTGIKGYIAYYTKEMHKKPLII
ncbi:uncharacterized protein T551_00686 [Pneumocystis jirovecii RU7]|uniref:Topoisomerase I damage affected protein 2 n=1 Tax=Pneumocystis jirovecii (strain RU7) TaxID=1408657 RepID=A0A0W4ZUK3_PNEJ7|nr:uncharacterized protein T551_00686 [Pneumocystis jirovecii RU7]KTW32004.1 hypothetical protein T551_00686 [Pneumocystis jirovecii RU7]